MLALTPRFTQRFYLRLLPFGVVDVKCKLIRVVFFIVLDSFCPFIFGARLL